MLSWFSSALTIVSAFDRSSPLIYFSNSIMSAVHLSRRSAKFEYCPRFLLTFSSIISSSFCWIVINSSISLIWESMAKTLPSWTHGSMSPAFGRLKWNANLYEAIHRCVKFVLTIECRYPRASVSAPSIRRQIDPFPKNSINNQISPNIFPLFLNEIAQFAFLVYEFLVFRRFCWWIQLLYHWNEGF